MKKRYLTKLTSVLAAAAVIFTAGFAECRAAAEYADTETAADSATCGGQLVAAYACSLIGSPYAWGGEEPSTGFDCSGFVYYVYNMFGITLNRVAADQALNGIPVNASEIRAGDVICFYSNGGINHSGIYVGNGQFVHASTSETGVIMTDLAAYSQDGYTVRRIIF